MIDLIQEKPISLHEAAKIIGTGRGGRPMNFSTIWRWVLKGVKGPEGLVVRLEGQRLGGRWITSREALQRFSERLTPALGLEIARPRTPAAQKRGNDRAAKVLEAAGI